MDMPTREELDQIARQALAIDFSKLAPSERSYLVGNIEISARAIVKGDKSEFQSLLLTKMLLLVVFRARQIRGG
jgi:hypothetical protein